jgi:hypothetical protein
LHGGSIEDIATNASSLTFSAPNTTGITVTECPTNYVPVPALAPYTTNIFCVAKYEMKNVGGFATSVAAGKPWISVDRDASITACANLGTGFSLISNAQWQTIARNLEGVGFNWSAGTVGNAGGMSRGHSDNSPMDILPAVTDDNDSCSGTEQTCSLSSWNDQRRVQKLASGFYIWDFSGNVLEWVKDNSATNYGADDSISVLTAANHPVTGSIGSVVNNANYHFGPAGNFTALSSSPFGGLGNGYLNYSGGAILRGGSRDDGVAAGVFATNLVFGSAFTNTNVGFRCVWSP